MKTVAVLGSTGSIGEQTLDVIARLAGEFRVVALAAHSSWQKVGEQAQRFGVTEVALASEHAAGALHAEHPNLHVGTGAASVAALIDAVHPDIVINALVGAAGLRATLAAIDAGVRLGLANKESLVIGGDLVMPLVAPGQLLPVDSEHSAIFQCLEGEQRAAVSRFWITASGGPFRGRDRAFLAAVTPEQALAHPTWHMGPKISIDSATLMNKGLEVIEAHHLFGASFDEIAVVVHPQSCVHSMVEYSDGSVKAHLGATDMRIPIEYALTYPERGPAPVTPVDFRTLGALEFSAPDLETFGCLALAVQAGRVAGTAPVVLNAANEIAVAAFLAGRIGFLDIEGTVARALDHFPVQCLESVDHIESVDAETRIFAEDLVTRASR